MAATARHVGITAIAGYLPQRWMDAQEIAAATGIRPASVVDKFGVRGKHVAADDEHVSDMAAEAGRQVLKESAVAAEDIGAVVYFGSTWKDYAVWQAAPKIAHELGCANAFALELDYVSCGAPVALRVCRDMLIAEPRLGTVLAVAATRESHLLDYDNQRARFMFTFGDGAVAALLTAADSPPQVELLGSHMITDGSFADDVKVPAGGSVEPASHASVRHRRHHIDVEDPAAMAARLWVTLGKFTDVAQGALERSGLTLADLDFVCSFHMKRTAHKALLDALGVPPQRAEYLDDTGHMSGVDTLFALDRAARAGRLRPGDNVLLIASGTGCTWAASVVRWGIPTA